MSNGAKISFVVATHQRYNVIEDCINSILKQNYNNIEILIVNDGHDLIKRAIIEKYIDPRIHYYEIEKVTGGYGGEQKNFGIKASKGDYIVFLDDDNIIHSNYLESLIPHLNDDLGMIIYKVRLFNNHFNMTCKIIPTTDEIINRDIDTLCGIFNRKYIKDIEWAEKTEGDDFLFFSNCVEHFKSNNIQYKFIDDVIADHRYLLHIDYKEFYDSYLSNICVSTTIAQEDQYRLNFFLDYYLNFVKAKKIIIYDSNSNKETIDLINKWQNEYKNRIDLIKRDITEWDERNTMLVKNEYWKDYRSDNDYNWYDWQITCDIDEYLYHPNLLDILEKYKSLGVTIPLVKGFDMVANEPPKFENSKFLPTLINRGIYSPKHYSKNVVFNPKKVDINFTFGSDHCQPSGVVKYSDDLELFLMHYKYLGYEYLINRSKLDAPLLSEWCKHNNHNVHVLSYTNFTKDMYNRIYNQGSHIFADEFLLNKDFGYSDIKDLKALCDDHIRFAPKTLEIGALNKNSTELFSLYVDDTVYVTECEHDFLTRTPNVKIIQISEIEDHSLDLIFIHNDEDHSYLLSKLKPNGKLCVVNGQKYTSKYKKQYYKYNNIYVFIV